MITIEKPTPSKPLPADQIPAFDERHPALADESAAVEKPAGARFAALSRWLHLYLSLVTFALVFFFAVTGITLNHADWFYQGKQRTAQFRGKVEPRWVKPAAVAKMEVVEHLRRVHGIKGAVSDFRVEDAQCAVSFKGPGYMADTFINRATGEYELTETRMGFVAVINDLHKGRDTGGIWSWVIDISAALMAVVSATGLALIFFMKRRRTSGLLMVLLGTLVSLAIYFLWVP